jgi:hypothetical protein
VLLGVPHQLWNRKFGHSGSTSTPTKGPNDHKFAKLGWAMAALKMAKTVNAV